MADLPYMPVFGDAYLAATAHLSYEEKGLYMDLLLVMWQSPEGRIPNDEKWLTRRFRLSPEQVTNTLRPLIAEFCQSTGNWLTQKRVQRERERALGKSKKQSVRAKSRWQNEKKDAVAMQEKPAAAMPTKPIPKHTPTEDSLPLKGEGSAPTLFGSPVLSTVETKLPKGPPIKPEKPGKLSVCPPEWEPTPEHHALGDELGLTPREVHESASGMRDWSLSGGNKKLDWNATFRNWMRRDAAERRKHSGLRPQQKKPVSWADIANAAREK